MTVRYFVWRDADDRPQPPENSHEVTACKEIIKRLWMTYNGQDALYAVIANLRTPSADMVIVTDYGLGVVEIKHNSGVIRQSKDAWFADDKPIKCGSLNSQGERRYHNPHHQVQTYAHDIRQQLLTPNWKPGWLPGDESLWREIKIQTAVCFTHPSVDVTDVKDYFQRNRPSHLQPWEAFKVLSPADVSDWAAALRFEVNLGKAGKTTMYRLSHEQVIRIATALLKATEWHEIDNLMPTGEPYAYLALYEHDQPTQVFGIDHEEITLGRNPDVCTICVPQYLERVSRKHAQIKRDINGKIWLEDLASKNGTFVNGEAVGESRELKQGQIITLGGPAAGERICQLLFSRDPIPGVLDHGTMTRTDLNT